MGMLPEIATDLGAPIPTAGHAITAYALGVVVGAPTIAVLGARMDRRRLLLLLMVGVRRRQRPVGVRAEHGAARRRSGSSPGCRTASFFGVGAVMGVAVVGIERRGRAVAAMMAGLTIACAVGVPLTVGRRATRSAGAGRSSASACSGW